MRLSFVYTIVVLASLARGQTINALESSPDPSATFSTFPNTFNGGKSVPPTSFRPCSNTLSQPSITKKHENGSRTPANIQEVGATSTASYGISPSSPPVSVSMALSDATPSQMMTAGTTSETVSSSVSIQSSMTAMSKSTAFASGSRTSRTANVRRRGFSWQKARPTDLIQATNTTTTSAPTTGLGNKNIAGQIRGFADTAGILVLIGMFAGL